MVGRIDMKHEDSSTLPQLSGIRPELVRHMLAALYTCKLAM